MNRNTKQLTVLAAAVAVLAVWLHWPAVHHALVRWDDDVYLRAAMERLPLTMESVRRTFGSAVPFYYQPLTMLSHELAFQAWGWQPSGHHAVNILLHGANAALVVVLAWLLMTSVTKLSGAQRVAIAVGVGLTFAIHPLQVQAVTWVAERKTVLSGCFALASLCAYLIAVDKRTRVWWWITIVCFALSLLAKPMAVALPLVMLVLDVYPLGRLAAWGWWRLLKEKTILFALSASSCLLTMVGPAQEGSLIGLGHVSLGLRLLEAAHGPIFYLEKLVWPVWLSPYYPPPDEGWPTHRELLMASAVFVVISAVIAVNWRRVPALAAAWIACVVLLLPVSGLIQAGSHEVVADRYAYLAMVPLLLVMAGGLWWLWRRLAGPGRLALVGLLVCNFVFWGFQTRAQIGVWRNDETLWSEVLQHFPESSRAKGDLAMALARQGRFEEALPLAQASARATPDFWLARTTLGFVYLGAKQYDEAERELRRAVALNPNSAVAQYDLACASSRLGKFAESGDALHEAVRLDARYAQVARNDPDLEPLKNHPDFGF